MYITEGGVGIFSFVDLANFWFGYSVFALKNCSFSVLVSCVPAGFLQYFSPWFSIFVNNNGSLSDFSVHCSLRFFWFCQGSYNL